MHTQAVYEGKSPKQFRASQEQEERKLQMLDNAVELLDLQSPPGNKLENLRETDMDNTVSESINKGVYALYGQVNLAM